MKRDMDLIRDMLVAVENDEHREGQGIVHFSMPGRDHDQVRYHAKKLQESGLIKAQFFLGGEFVILDLTSSGHDFLDAIRSETVWSRLKKKAASEGGTIPLEIMKPLAIQFMKESLGLQ